MKLCPVDLRACDRPDCAGGHCEMAEAPRLVVCWECGTPHDHDVARGTCLACVAVYAAAPHDEREKA